MATQRIKVNVAELVKAIEKKRAEKVAAYDRAVAKFERDSATFPEEVEAALEKAHASALRGKLPRQGEEYINRSYQTVLYVPIKMKNPRRPAAIDTSGFDRDIKLLKMSADAELIISANSEFARYL